MSVQVRLCDLASARHVQLSVKMPAAVSMSMNHSSNFEESCQSNVGIFWSMVVVRLDSLCVAGCLCMPAWFCGQVPHWTGANWSAMVRCCSLSVSCNISSVDVDWGVLDFRLAKWLLSCWNCSSKPAMGWQY